MQIQKIHNGTTLRLALEGRLDTMTSPELEAELKGSTDGVEELVLDLTNLEYISSAGLRVILSAQKLMNAKKGTMRVLNASAGVMEVFEMTGFANVLCIEK